MPFQKSKGSLVRHLVSFGESPFGTMKQPPSLSCRHCWNVKNLLEKIKNALVAKLQGRLILVKRGSAQVFFI